MANTIGILLFDGAEEMDFVGPWEVLTAAVDDLADERVVTIAERPEPVVCEKGSPVLCRVSNCHSGWQAGSTETMSNSELRATSPTISHHEPSQKALPASNRQPLRRPSSSEPTCVVDRQRPGAWILPAEDSSFPANRPTPPDAWRSATLPDGRS